MACADEATVTLPPADLAVPISYLVRSEVSYNCTLVVSHTITGMRISPPTCDTGDGAKACS